MISKILKGATAFVNDIPVNMRINLAYIKARLGYCTTSGCFNKHSRVSRICINGCYVYREVCSNCHESEVFRSDTMGQESEG